MAENKSGKGFLNAKFFSSAIKGSEVKLFPEGLLGYLLGPIMALISNAIINTYLLRYYTDVMGLGSDGWAGSALFLVLLQVLSAIVIVAGNMLVGKLMDKVKSKNGKARPLLFASMPLIALALFILFLAPFPWKEESLAGIKVLKLDETVAMWSMIVMAVGYNAYYAICYPFYYTSHSALVNLSTRDSNKRTLLATLSNGAVVASAGLAGMVMPYFLNLLFVPETIAREVEAGGIKTTVVRPYDASSFDTAQGWKINTYDKLSSYNNWKIFLIALVVTLVIGAIIEFYFTRERITEEEFARGDVETKETAKAVPMKDQIAVCMKDKYWWMIMIFFFLYQLGGMMKNNSATYFAVAWSGDANLAGTISIIGAIPTAVGMVAVGFLTNKFGKANTIKWGAVIAAAMGALSIVLLNVLPAEAVAGVSIAGFVLKAIGTVPAMYVSLALLSDVLDHQEAKHGFRTDGFSMAVYGAIMIAMTGIANGIIAGLVSAAGYATSASSPAMMQVTNWIFFGGETIGYAIIAIIFFFMNVEKYSKEDHEKLAAMKPAAEQTEAAEEAESIAPADAE